MQRDMNGASRTLLFDRVLQVICPILNDAIFQLFFSFPIFFPSLSLSLSSSSASHTLCFPFLLSLLAPFNLVFLETILFSRIRMMAMDFSRSLCLGSSVSGKTRFRARSDFTRRRSSIASGIWGCNWVERLLRASLQCCVVAPSTCTMLHFFKVFSWIESQKFESVGPS